MERTLNIRIVPLLIGGLLCLTASCTPYAERKAAMEARWEQSAARAKLPMVEEYLQQGRLKDAFKLLHKCLEADPELAEAHCLMGRIYLAQGQTRIAEESFTRAVDLNPQLDEAWFARGGLAQDAEQLEAAAEYYEKALALKPLHVDYILRVAYLYDLQDRTAQAEELLNRSLRQLPGEVPLLQAQAQMLQRRREFSEAAALLEQARYQSGQDPQVLEMLGVCYMSQREWAAAQKIFEELLVSKDLKNYESLLQWTGVCALNAGRYSRALKYFNQLSVYRREDPQLWLEMAQAALGAQLPERARECAQKALRYQPGWMEAQAALACSYYTEKQYAQAAAAFDPLCRDEKWGPFGWWMTGRCWQQLGQISKAREAFGRAVVMEPDSPLIKMFTLGSDPAL